MAYSVVLRKELGSSAPIGASIVPEVVQVSHDAIAQRTYLQARMKNNDANAGHEADVAFALTFADGSKAEGLVAGDGRVAVSAGEVVDITPIRLTRSDVSGIEVTVTDAALMDVKTYFGEAVAAVGATSESPLDTTPVVDEAPVTPSPVAPESPSSHFAAPAPAPAVPGVPPVPPTADVSAPVAESAPSPVPSDSVSAPSSMPPAPGTTPDASSPLPPTPEAPATAPGAPLPPVGAAAAAASVPVPPVGGDQAAAAPESAPGVPLPPMGAPAGDAPNKKGISRKVLIAVAACVLLVGALVALGSCKGGSTDKIVGHWECTSLMNDGDLVPCPPNSGNILDVNADGSMYLVLGDEEYNGTWEKGENLEDVEGEIYDFDLGPSDAIVNLRKGDDGEDMLILLLAHNSDYGMSYKRG